MRKTCSKCGKKVTANLKNFYSDIKTNDGLSNNCKSCQKEYVKNTRKNESYRLYNNAYMNNYSKYKRNTITEKDFLNVILSLKKEYGIGMNSRSKV